MEVKNISLLLSLTLLIVPQVLSAGSNSNRGGLAEATAGQEPDAGIWEDEDSSPGTSSKDPSGPPRRVFRLWPDGVVKYKISPSLSSNPTEVARLRASMADLTKKTCVRFSEAPTGEVSYVSIIPGLKCSSMIGKQEGISTLMLSVKNCFGNGTIARNLMRVLGFTYENNRADRDQYIQVNMENIAESNKKKFNKLAAEDYPVTNLPYDFVSVTHYPKNSWAINRNSWTLRAKKDGNMVLGNTKGYSEGDYAKIRSLYKCR